ncbi:MAG: Sua5/YciO/YrdC/YwlC family protein, partial [Gammaproteobacteria bacterium]|nr:Sua5/YciO/YrdC/YwlC family protein [Gammaproteobacteria bacterium]
MGNWKLNQVARLVRKGGVIAYPTEAVYGIGCQPGNFPAVCRILEMKRRPMDKGLIVVAAAPEQLSDYIQFRDTEMEKRVLATWPGPVTWLVPARTHVPRWVRGTHSSIAVRVSAHPLVQELCTRAGPLISTSANPGSYPPAKTARKVVYYFGPAVDYVLNGPLGT